MTRWRTAIIIAAVLIAVLMSGAWPAFSQEYETPVTSRAENVLPKKLLSGADYRIDDIVASDGYLYAYLLHSRFGDFKVMSTALLYTRLTEIKAMAAMEQVSSASQFGGALADKGAQTVQGAANLLVHPVDTVGGALSGVGKMFARAQESLVESNPSKYEDSRFKKVIGYSQTKRDYAKQFGVDPYSTNAVLQERLDNLASAGYAGSITGSALQALIPGGVGAVIGGISGSAVLGEIDVSLPPEDLRRQNRQALLDMGISSSVARLFIDNDVFTPTQQTIIVQALRSMPKCQGKESFVSFLVNTDNQDLALFRQRMIQMYAGYNQTVAPVSGFMPLGRFIGVMKDDGTLVLAFPLDNLVWTSTNAVIVDAINDSAKSLPAARVEIWLTGKASPMTKKQLKRLGWKLNEMSAPKLLGVNY
jgi:hypothetical protein